MGRVCMGRVGYGPGLSWAEFVMGRDVQLPLLVPDRFVIRILHIAAHGPDSANRRASASGAGGRGFDPWPRHTKNKICR